MRTERNCDTSTKIQVVVCNSVFAEETREIQNGGERVAERTMLFKAVLDLHLLIRERIRRLG